MKTPTPLAALLLACTAWLAGCNPQDDTLAVPYGAVNHTDVGIASIVINGKGGAENSGPYEAGNAGMCCVIVPRRWHPGLTVTITWRENGKFLKDAKGHEVLDDGVPVLIEAPWKTRTVPLPKYTGEGRFFVFFFPGDDVRAAMTNSPEWKAWWEPTEADLKFGNRIKKP